MTQPWLTPPPPSSVVLQLLHSVRSKLAERPADDAALPEQPNPDYVTRIRCAIDGSEEQEHFIYTMFDNP